MRTHAAIGITALLLALGMLGGGCGDTSSTPPAVEAPATGTQVAQQAQTTCPIMGGPINKEVYADYEGKRVYFCCKGCDAAFKKDPAKYIKQLEDQGVVLAKTPADAGTP